MNLYCNIALVYKLPKVYTYKNNVAAKVGSIVIAPLRDKTSLGIVIEQLHTTNVEALNIITKTEYSIPNDMVEWIEKVAEYNLLNIGLIVNMILPDLIHDPISPYYYVNGIVQSISTCLSLFGKRGFIKSVNNNEIVVSKFEFQPNISLNSIQIEAIQKLKQYTNIVTLLKGPTGSGKTNIYVKIAEEVLRNGQKVLVLLPEIALTKQFACKIEKLLGHAPHIWTNETHKYAKQAIWQWSLSNASGILLGSRSALWLPYTNLGLIVVDEEHDISYKQESSPIYHARDMAVLRSKYEKCQCILVSATPSLETWYNTVNGKYKLVEISGYQPIGAHIIQKTKDRCISDVLQYEIANTLSKNEQVMLFLNRKGIASRILCTSCHKYYMCSECSSCLVFYKSMYCKCSYCSKVIEVGPCRMCKAKSWSLYGIGIERIEEEVSMLFPNAVIATLSSEHKNISHVISDIIDNKINIIITTQILSKGYTFPNLTLVAVLDGDDGTRSDDPRNQERIYQMLVQVRGRCGRSNKPSKILIQVQKQSKLIESVITNNYNSWANNHLVLRKAQHLPPFYKLIRILTASIDKKHAQVDINQIYNELCKLKYYKTYPPAPTPMQKYRSMFRYFILIRYENNQYPQKDIKSIINQVKVSYKTKVIIDVDPYSFY